VASKGVTCEDEPFKGPLRLLISIIGGGVCRGTNQAVVSPEPLVPKVLGAIVEFLGQIDAQPIGSSSGPLELPRFGGQLGAEDSPRALVDGLRSSL
jgi:hypothetical protein